MNNFKLIQTSGWSDYELIDSGGYEKLERFGEFTISRPEPQACWNKTLSPTEWDSLTHAMFIKSSDKERNSEKGQWVMLKKMKEQWFINYTYTSTWVFFKGF